MGKPTGFIEYLRELPLDRAAIKRIQDWNEFHHHMEIGKLQMRVSELKAKKGAGSSIDTAFGNANCSTGQSIYWSDQAFPISSASWTKSAMDAPTTTRRAAARAPSATRSLVQKLAGNFMSRRSPT